MLYRKAINWPLGNDDDPHAIAVSFVRESAHGEPFSGADTDGETVHVVISDMALSERLAALQATRGPGEPSPLSYPSPDRTALYADIFAYAEQGLLIAGEHVATSALPEFAPRGNLWTIAQEAEAYELEG